jgi:hypothetical protein
MRRRSMPGAGVLRARSGYMGDVQACSFVRNENRTLLCVVRFPRNLFCSDAVAPWSGGEGRRLIDTRPTCRILNTPRAELLSLDLGTDHC